MLFDTAQNTPTEDLAFESVIPGLLVPARCRCGRCGNPAAVAQPNTDGYAPGLGGQLREDGPPWESHKAVRVKMYATGISPEEAYEWVDEKPDEFRRICEEAKVKRFGYDLLGKIRAFLYSHPKQRDQAYDILRKHFKTAFKIANPVYVDLSE